MALALAGAALALAFGILVASTVRAMRRRRRWWWCCVRAEGARDEISLVRHDGCVGQVRPALIGFGIIFAWSAAALALLGFFIWHSRGWSLHTHVLGTGWSAVEGALLRGHAGALSVM
jgi:hypothetical protein